MCGLLSLNDNHQKRLYVCWAYFQFSSFNNSTHARHPLLHENLSYFVFSFSYVIWLLCFSGLLSLNNDYQQRLYVYNAFFQFLVSTSILFVMKTFSISFFFSYLIWLLCFLWLLSLNPSPLYVYRECFRQLNAMASPKGASCENPFHISLLFRSIFHFILHLFMFLELILIFNFLNCKLP